MESGKMEKKKEEEEERVEVEGFAEKIQFARNWKERKIIFLNYSPKDSPYIEQFYILINFIVPSKIFLS